MLNMSATTGFKISILMIHYVFEKHWNISHIYMYYWNISVSSKRERGSFKTAWKEFLSFTTTRQCWCCEERRGIWMSCLYGGDRSRGGGHTKGVSTLCMQVTATVLHNQTLGNSYILDTELKFNDQMTAIAQTVNKTMIFVPLILQLTPDRLL